MWWNVLHWKLGKVDGRIWFVSDSVEKHVLSKFFGKIGVQTN